jgi:hypothetical protein
MRRGGHHLRGPSFDELDRLLATMVCAFCSEACAFRIRYIGSLFGGLLWKRR